MILNHHPNNNNQRSHFVSVEVSDILEAGQASITWLKDGQPAQNRPRIRIHGSKSDKLEILSVFKEDSGVYQCFVTHGTQQYQASAELRLGGSLFTFLISISIECLCTYIVGTS